MTNSRARSLIEQLYQENPLMRFSTYTDAQVKVMRELGKGILRQIDTSLATPGEIGGSLDYYGQFWLWTIGAYEIVRTMKQARSCFSSGAGDRIVSFEKRIRVLRIPFAKQEFAGNSKEPINGEASIYGFDFPRKDMLFEVRGAIVGARELIEAFESLIASLSSDDVLTDLRRRS